MNRRSMLLRAALAVLAPAAGVPAAAAAEPYRLGVLMGFTGPGAPYSDDGLRGIEIAVAEINAKGGLLGKHPIELVVGNDRTNPEVARAQALDLVKAKKVRAIIGTYSSAAALAIKPICRDNGVLHIATISNAEEITKLDPSPFTFSVVPNTYMMAKATAIAAADLARQKGWRTYATVASDYAWGRSSQSLQVALLKERAPALRLVAALWPPLGEPSFNGYVVALQRAAPDFALVSVAGTDNLHWQRAAHDYRLAGRVQTPFALVSLVELMRDGKLLRRGVHARTRAPFFAHLDQPMMRAFVDAFRTRHKAWPGDWAVMSYDGVHALRQAVEAANAIDSDAVRAALAGRTVETTRGRLAFRAIDNQLGVSGYVGRIADDPRYPFPIFADLVELKGPDIWRPEAEILAARRK